MVRNILSIVYTLLASVGMFFLAKNLLWPAIFGIEWNLWKTIIVLIASPFIYLLLSNILFMAWAAIPASFIGLNKAIPSMCVSTIILIAAIVLVVTIWMVDVDFNLSRIIIAILLTYGLLSFAVQSFTRVHDLSKKFAGEHF